MAHDTFMNIEVLLDAVGVCCFVMTVLYLVKLKRKALFCGRLSVPTQQGDNGSFKTTPIGMPSDISFEGVLVSAKNDFQISVAAASDAADPYDEVRRLLNLGMEPHQIAERIKIPRCEIDLIVNLRQIQPDLVSGKTTEKENCAILA